MFNLLIQIPDVNVEYGHNKGTGTLALLSEEEEAGELASSSVWHNVPAGDSVRQVGDIESMSAICFL